MFRFYNPSVNISLNERNRLENDLKRAIDQNQLLVLYQPQINIRTGKMSHAEALVRWKHPERGMLEPHDFIPLAEEIGYVAEIDQWVLRTVCGDTGRRLRARQDPFMVTVNLSMQSLLRHDLPDTIASLLRKTGMEPGFLNLEFTENTAMKDVEMTFARLQQLRGMGLHISIDDFGTGYSSFHYLKKLPIESIKIDKTFIRDIAGDADDRVMISAVTSMAHTMGIRTVAEGVETQEQLEFVRNSECDEAQGYFFSRPVVGGKLTEMLGAGKW